MPVANFLLALIAIFVAAKLFGELAERVGQPAVLGELVGGVLVGVSGLKLVDPNTNVIHLLAQLGIVLLLFLIGLETELQRLVACGPAALVVAIAAVRIAAIAFGFVAGALVVGSYLAPLLVRAIDRIHVARGIFFASIVFALTLAYVAQRAGTAIIIGSFAAGLVLARTEKGDEIKRQVNEVVQFFVPIFFVAVGAAIDVKTLNPLDPPARRFLVVGVLLAVVAVAGKIA